MESPVRFSRVFRGGLPPCPRRLPGKPFLLLLIRVIRRKESGLEDVLPRSRDGRLKPLAPATNDSGPDRYHSDRSEESLEGMPRPLSADLGYSRRALQRSFGPFHSAQSLP